jgi:hypothetical protein
MLVLPWPVMVVNPAARGQSRSSVVSEHPREVGDVAGAALTDDGSVDHHCAGEQIHPALVDHKVAVASHHGRGRKRRTTAR